MCVCVYLVFEWGAAGASASCDAGVVPVEQDDPGPVDEVCR